MTLICKNLFTSKIRFLSQNVFLSLKTLFELFFQNNYFFKSLAFPHFFYHIYFSFLSLESSGIFFRLLILYPDNLERFFLFK